MSPPVKQSTFSGGEVTPALYARTDHALYDKSLRTLRNMMAMRHGGVTGRPGTMFVHAAQNAGAAVRLIPFIFNETGLGQSYVLEFGAGYIGFYQNGGVVTSGGSPYVISSPYAQGDLASLKFAESADVVTITHPSYAPRELSRISATSWSLNVITFGSAMTCPTINSLSTAVGTARLMYGITTVDALGNEANTAHITTIYNLTGTIGTPTAPNVISWGAVSSLAVSLRIYFSSVYESSPGVGVATAWGYIATVTPDKSSFNDTGVVPDYTQAPPLYNNVFNSSNNYPSAVGFIQQRRAFGSTTNNPLGFWESKPGSFANFDTRLGVPDDDPVIASISGEEVNAIQHILELKFMLLLTAGAEIYVQGNGSGVVTPSAINASTQSQYGCSSLRPLKVGDTLLFNQALGSFVRDFTFDFAVDGYRGNDLTVFASHLFEGYSLSDWCYQKIPDSIVWAVRSDGVLLSCTYVREQQVLAWAHHDFENGIVENVCSIPENGQYAVYLSIKRVINGATVRYIERMSSRIWTDPLTATYLDSFASYDGRNTGATTMTLTASGGFSASDTAYQQQLTLTSSVGFFTAGMVGDQIFIYDTEWVNSQGSSGNCLRCTIQAFTSTTVVTVTPSGLVPSTFQSAATTNWAHAVKSVSGLDYLAGQEVSVWADRYVVGSPLNYHLPTVYTVSTAGVLALDKCYSVIYVGLPMIQDFETLDIETGAGESILAKRKRAAKLAIYLMDTRTLFAGSENPDNNLDNTDDQELFQLYELKRGTSMVTYDEPPELVTDQDFIIEESRFNKNGRLFIRNVDPTPLTILAVSPQAESPAPSPFYQKV